MPTFDTPEPISVIVELGVGDIRIVASDRTDTVVEVRPSDPGKKGDVTAAEQTHVDFTAGRLLVRGPKGWRQWTFRGGTESIDVQIDVPAGSEVEGSAGVGSLRCSGRLGDCQFQTGLGDIRLDGAGSVELKSGLGDITVDRAAGRAEVTTGSGALDIRSIDGPAVIKNSNGDTRMGDVSGDLRVHAANGKISIDQAHATVAAKTAFGDIRLDHVEKGAVVVQSGFGSVEVRIRDGVPAWLDLHTGFGNVQNDLDATDRPGAGEDSVELRARTSYGDIIIGRSSAGVAGKDEE